MLRASLMRFMAWRRAMVGALLLVAACGSGNGDATTTSGTATVTTQGVVGSTSPTSATSPTSTLAPGTTSGVASTTPTDSTTTVVPSTTTTTAGSTTTTSTTTTTAAPTTTMAATVTPTTAAPTTTTTQPAPKTARIDLVNFEIRPSAVTIRVGDTVRWTNVEGAHTTTSGTGGGAYVKDGRWDSGFIAEGSAFSVTFAEAGQFSYFCEIHPDQMQATITVQP